MFITWTIIENKMEEEATLQNCITFFLFSVHRKRCWTGRAAGRKENNSFIKSETCVEICGQWTWLPKKNKKLTYVFTHSLQLNIKMGDSRICPSVDHIFLLLTEKATFRVWWWFKSLHHFMSSVMDRRSHSMFGFEIKEPYVHFLSWCSILPWSKSPVVHERVIWQLG